MLVDKFSSTQSNCTILRLTHTFVNYFAIVARLMQVEGR